MFMCVYGVLMHCCVQWNVIRSILLFSNRLNGGILKIGWNVEWFMLPMEWYSLFWDWNILFRVINAFFMHRNAAQKLNELPQIDLPFLFNFCYSNLSLTSFCCSLTCHLSLHFHLRFDSHNYEYSFYYKILFIRTCIKCIAFW